jgi:phospholipase/carboxylesterase
MGTPDLGFEHRFIPGRDPAGLTLLLLHGTGGNQDDLLSLGEALVPGAAYLSPRGKVSENGRARFFRRFAEGIFDVEDLRRRAAELADFVAAAKAAYGLGPRPPVAVGLSNGANIATAVLLLHPGTLGGALLLRPMVPLTPDPLPQLGGVPVQINAGRYDPVVGVGESDALAALLRRSGADAHLEWIDAGHTLTREDVDIGRRWFGLSSLSPLSAGRQS